jgi:nitrogen fixation/metabolism regulation signal transduction histidine kinase
VFPYFAIWVIVLTLTAPVLTIAMMLSGLVPEYLHGDIWFFLFTRVPLIALAGVGLAVFSTARTAGPMVKLKRVFEDVTRGDMDSRLRLRRGDQAYQELETAFNEMMEAVNERLGSRRGLEAEDDSYSRPESESVLG